MKTFPAVQHLKYQKRCPQEVMTGVCALFWQSRQLNAAMCCSLSTCQSCINVAIFKLYKSFHKKSSAPLQLKIMSVQIILSHKQIEIDNYNRATLNLKAIFSTLPANLFALYKVRTNSKDMVDVRPSFGYLHNQNEENAVASMQIKFLGNVETLRKMKLQVSWVWGEGPPQKKLSHTEFSEQYAILKEKIGKQKTHMLDFISHDQARKGQEATAVFKSTQSIVTKDEKGDSREEEDGLQSVQSQIKQSSKSTKMKKTGSLWIILAILVTFMLGILFGMKIEQEIGVLKNSNIGVYSEQAFQEQSNPETAEDPKTDEILIQSPQTKNGGEMDVSQHLQDKQTEIPQVQTEI